MKNPLSTLKALIIELQHNGREGLALAQSQLSRIDAVEQRLLAAESARAESRAAQAAQVAQATQIAQAAQAALVAEIARLAEALGAAHAEAAAGQAALAGRFDALELRLTPPEPPPPEEARYFGLDGLDQMLEAYLDYDNGYFVELGANDGLAQSNTLHFERFRGWRGILVEPTPHNFLRCLENRAPSTQSFCCACTAFGYPDRFVEIAFSNLMSTPIGLDSDIADPRAHAETGRRFLAPHERVFSFGAVARPLNDLLVEGRAPRRIDLLSLDVEGAELEVLRGVDHRAYRFRFICIESRDLGRISAYLSEHGYDFVRTLTHHDHLFRDRDWPVAGT